MTLGAAGEPLFLLLSFLIFKHRGESTTHHEWLARCYKIDETMRRLSRRIFGTLARARARTRDYVMIALARFETFSESGYASLLPLLRVIRYVLFAR